MSGRASAIGPNLMRVLQTPPSLDPITGRTYLAITAYTAPSGFNYIYKLDASEMADGGSGLAESASLVTGETISGVFASSNAGLFRASLRRTAHLIATDSGGYVSDNAVAFYRGPDGGAHASKLFVWDVYNSGAGRPLYSMSASMSGGPVYYGGYLYYLWRSGTTLWLKRVRCDLTGDAAVTSQSIGTVASVSDRVWFDGTSLLLSVYSGAGQPSAFYGFDLSDASTVTDGYTLIGRSATTYVGSTKGSTGIPAADGTVFSATWDAPDPDAGTAVVGAVNLDTTGTDESAHTPLAWSLVENTFAGGFGQSVGCSVSPDGSEVAIYPVGETSAASQTLLLRVLASGDLSGYAAQATLPTITTDTISARQPTAMLALD